MFRHVEYIARTCDVHKCQSQDLNGEEANVINDTHMCINTWLLLTGVIMLLLTGVIMLLLMGNLLTLTILKSNKINK